MAPRRDRSFFSGQRIHGVHFPEEPAWVKKVGAGYRPINDVYTIRGLHSWREKHAVGFVDSPKRATKPRLDGRLDAAGAAGLPRWQGPGF